jgi:hypothetical protein
MSPRRCAGAGAWTIAGDAGRRRGYLTARGRRQDGDTDVKKLMRRASGNRGIHAAAALLAIAQMGLAPASPARAAASPPAYDGVWIIDATTSSFFCPIKSKRIVAFVRDGQVTKLTGIPAAASGRIGPDGVVSFILKLLGVTATVTGQMNGGSGAGGWSSNSILCARGDWRASMR